MRHLPECLSLCVCLCVRACARAQVRHLSYTVKFAHWPFLRIGLKLNLHRFTKGFTIFNENRSGSAGYVSAPLLLGRYRRRGCRPRYSRYLGTCQ